MMIIDRHTLYAGVYCCSCEGDPGEDDVRAPIPQRQETVVEPGFEGYNLRTAERLANRNRVRTVFDGFRNFGSEASKKSVEKDIELGLKVFLSTQRAMMKAHFP